jgi:hypothetical protein
MLAAADLEVAFDSVPGKASPCGVSALNEAVPANAAADEERK